MYRYEYNSKSCLPHLKSQKFWKKSLRSPFKSDMKKISQFEENLSVFEENLSVLRSDYSRRVNPA